MSLNSDQQMKQMFFIHWMDLCVFMWILISRKTFPDQTALVWFLTRVYFLVTLQLRFLWEGWGWRVLCRRVWGGACCTWAGRRWGWCIFSWFFNSAFCGRDGAGEACVAVCEVVQEGAEDHQLTREVSRHIQHHGGRHQGQGDAPAAGHRHARLVITPDLQIHLKIRSDVKYKLFNYTQFHITNIKQL